MKCVYCGRDVVPDEKGSCPYCGGGSFKQDQSIHEQLFEDFQTGAHWKLPYDVQAQEAHRMEMVSALSYCKTFDDSWIGFMKRNFFLMLAGFSIGALICLFFPGVIDGVIGIFQGIAHWFGG